VSAAAFADKRAARLAAVQGLFSMELSGSSASSVENEGRMGRLPILRDDDNEGDGTATVVALDEALFGGLISGAVEQQTVIDRRIAERLADGWRLERLDAVVRAILRAGVTELLRFRATPLEVVIDEYVEIARMFFDGPEPGFINATLDSVAKARDAM
jgi:N utilization substance protein B